MPSTVILITSIASLIGFAINILVMVIILLRGRRLYHYLFASLLFIAACWDFGIFLVMIRNSHLKEIILYHNLLTIPFYLFPAFVYHFTTTYLNQSHKKSTIALYIFCILNPLGYLTGVYQPFSSVYNYNWGNFGKTDLNAPMIAWSLVFYISIFVSCYFLIQAYNRESSLVTQRHIAYIFISLIIYSTATIKILVSLGVDVPLFLPFGILLVGFFGAVIGAAILKDRLFDITVFVRRGIIYSSLAIIIIFIFDFSQHLLAMFLGEVAGGHSTYIHLASIGIVVIAFMPLKRKLEQMIGNALAKKKIEF